MYKNIMSVVLSASVIFYAGTAAAAEKHKISAASAEYEISDAPIDFILTENYVSPAFERFNIAESIEEIENPVEVTTPAPPQINEEAKPGYSENDLYWLSRIIEAEASGESMEGKIAVGNCVINRVKSTEFPNTIYDVIFDRKHGVQYQPTANGAIYNTPSADSVNAAIASLNGTDIVGKAMYFCSTAVAPNSWAANNRPYHTTIGNHVFYL